MARLTPVRVVILVLVAGFCNASGPPTKSQVTNGRPRRTQENWWKMIEQLVEAGMLDRIVTPGHPDRFEPTMLGWSQVGGREPIIKGAKP